jgi:hypothetical protein
MVWEAVADRHLAVPQILEQLCLMITGHTQRPVLGDHVHHYAQHTRGVRAAIDQVADEHSHAALRMCPAVRCGLPAQLREQLLQLETAAVHIPDDVERAGQFLAVVEQLLVPDLHIGYVAEDVDLAEPFPL